MHTKLWYTFHYLNDTKILRLERWPSVGKLKEVKGLLHVVNLIFTDTTFLICLYNPHKLCPIKLRPNITQKLTCDHAVNIVWLLKVSCAAK